MLVHCLSRIDIVGNSPRYVVVESPLLRHTVPNVTGVDIVRGRTRVRAVFDNLQPHLATVPVETSHKERALVELEVCWIVLVIARAVADAVSLVELQRHAEVVHRVVIAADCQR